MGRPAKKIDGRSKEARALRAKATSAPRKARAKGALAKPSLEVRVAKLPKAVNAAHKGALKRLARKPRVKPDAGLTFDQATSLRFHALQVATEYFAVVAGVGDLVMLARQIEEFLTGADTQAVVMGAGSLHGYAGMSAETLNRAIVTPTLADAEHAFD